MPFWMSGSTLLNLLLLLPYQHLGPEAWRLALIAFAIQALAIPFSLFGPVPINNRIVNWTPQSHPNDWEKQASLGRVSLGANLRIDCGSPR